MLKKIERKLLNFKNGMAKKLLILRKKDYTRFEELPYCCCNIKKFDKFHVSYEELGFRKIPIFFYIAYRNVFRKMFSK